MILASTDEDTMGGGVEVMVQTENENQYYNYSRVFTIFTTVLVLPIVVRLVLWVTDVTEKVKRGSVNSRLRGNKSSKRLKKNKNRERRRLCARAVDLLHETDGGE